MKIRNDVRLSAILMLGDIFAVNFAVLFSYWLRFNSGLFRIVYGVPHVSEYFKVLPIITVILVFLMRSDKLYSIRARLSIVDEFFVIVRTSTMGILLFMAATFVYREYSFSRGMLLILWLVLIAFVSSWRFFVNRVRFFRRSRSGRSRNLVMIGDGPMVNRLIDHISGDPHWDYNLKGVIRTRSGNDSDPGGVPVLGTLERLSEIIGSNEIDEVILTDTRIPRSKIMDIILECEKRMIEFRLVADLLGMVTSQVDMRTIDGVPLLGLKESPLSEGYNRVIKRAVDVVLSAVGIVVLAPLFLVIGVIVKLSSPGPVL